MSENNQSRRSEMLTEYYKLYDFVQKHDEHCLTIKAWSVTLGSAAIGLAFIQATSPLFIAGFLLSFAFWVTEVRFKLFQLNHLLRISELEKALTKNLELPTPRILGAFSEEAAANYRTNRWYSVLFWPQVMFPHLFFMLVNGIAGIIQLFP